MSFAASALLLLGCAFLFLGALGIVRMPDLYLRMSASSKAVTLGVGFMVIALAIHLRDATVTTRAVLLIVLFFLKAPVAAHMLGRAAYTLGVPLWESTHMDEMKQHQQDRNEPTP